MLTYDAANQHLTGAQYFDGRAATYTYNTTGNAAQLHALTAVASSCCNWRYFSFDAFGRLVGTYLGANAEALTFTYGYGNGLFMLPLNGLPVFTGLPSSGGPVCTVTDGLGNTTQFHYDNNGLLAKAVDGLGNAVHLAFDDNYNLVSIIDPAGRSYNYGYDSMGNVVQATDPLANQSRFSFTRRTAALPLSPMRKAIPPIMPTTPTAMLRPSPTPTTAARAGATISRAIPRHGTTGAATRHFTPSTTMGR